MFFNATIQAFLRDDQDSRHQDFLESVSSENLALSTFDALCIYENQSLIEALKVLIYLQHT